MCARTPPTLILHGNIDLIVPIKHSELLCKSLTDASVPVEMMTVPFAGHGGWNDREMTKAANAAFKFLDKHLKNKK
ncbi:MAG: prolyl oligopeptidase family serine peptidase [Gemmataceae bacterium]